MEKQEIQLLNTELKKIQNKFVKLTDENTFKKECSFAMQHFNKNDFLAKSTIESKLEAVLNVAQIGLTLNPVLKFAYLVPRSAKIGGQFVVQCHLEPSYQGLVKLITDTGSATSVYAHIVYEGDEFEETLGTSVEILHRPKRTSKEIKMVYAVAVLQDGKKQVEVMTVEEVNEIREGSESYKAFLKNKNIPCIWEKHYSEMARKTVIKRLCKYLPKTQQWEKIAQAIELTNEDFRCTVGQIGLIESLLMNANITDEDKNRIEADAESLSFDAATKTIKWLKENQLNGLTHSLSNSATDIANEVGEIYRESKNK